MLSSRPFGFSGPLLAIAAIAALQACGDVTTSSTTTNLGGFGGIGGQGTSTSGGAGGGGASGPQEFTYAAYCGVAACVPGTENTCEAAGGTGGAGPGTSGAGGGSTGGGATGGAGSGGTPSAGGMDGGELGCTIVNDGGTPVSTCAQIGTKQDGEVCYGGAECAEGLGCVLAVDPYGEGAAGPQAVGQCKPYCCGDLEAGCPDETTFCALRPMFDAVAKEDGTGVPLSVPVCVPTTPCTLLGGDCDVGETCTIVRESTGTTSCVPVGDGTTCQPCPCAADHICSYSTGTCLKLCAPNLETCPGAGALCQGGMIASVGVCIGGDAVCE